MKTRVAKLIGPALNYAVALAAGLKPHALTEKYCGQQRELQRYVGLNLGPGGCDVYDPDENWSIAGPLLNSARISRTIDHSGLWIAYHGFNYSDDKEHMQCHTSELVAGLRCYVSMRLGATVEIPDDLL